MFFHRRHRESHFPEPCSHSAAGTDLSQGFASVLLGEMRFLDHAHPLARFPTVPEPISNRVSLKQTFVADRDAFLQDVAAALQGRSKIGDGDIHRAIVTAQKRHWDPPQLDHDVSQGSTLTRQAPPALVFAPHLGRPRAF
jgi:hypothetical protein